MDCASRPVPAVSARRGRALSVGQTWKKHVVILACGNRSGTRVGFVVTSHHSPVSPFSAVLSARTTIYRFPLACIRSAVHSPRQATYESKFCRTFFRAIFPFLPIALSRRSSSVTCGDSSSRGTRASAPASVMLLPRSSKRPSGTTALAFEDPSCLTRASSGGCSCRSHPWVHARSIFRTT